MFALKLRQSETQILQTEMKHGRMILFYETKHEKSAEMMICPSFTRPKGNVTKLIYDQTATKQKFYDFGL